MTDNTTKELRRKAECAFSDTLDKAIEIIEGADDHAGVPGGDPLVLGTLFGRAGAHITAEYTSAVCTISVPDEDGDIKQYSGEAYFKEAGSTKAAYEQSLYSAVIRLLSDNTPVFTTAGVGMETVYVPLPNKGTIREKQEGNLFDALFSIMRQHDIFSGIPIQADTGLKYDPENEVITLTVEFEDTQGITGVLIEEVGSRYDAEGNMLASLRNIEREITQRLAKQ